MTPFRRGQIDKLKHELAVEQKALEFATSDFMRDYTQDRIARIQRVIARLESGETDRPFNPIQRRGHVCGSPGTCDYHFLTPAVKN